MIGLDTFHQVTQLVKELGINFSFVDCQNVSYMKAEMPILFITASSALKMVHNKQQALNNILKSMPE